MKFKIEKHVKVTSPRPGKPNLYPFDDMQPGDSFVIPIKDENDNAAAVSWCRVQGNVSQCFRSWRMAEPRKRGHLVLVTRNRPEGLRCWIHKNPWGDEANVD